MAQYSNRSWRDEASVRVSKRVNSEGAKPDFSAGSLDSLRCGWLQAVSHWPKRIACWGRGELYDHFKCPKLDEDRLTHLVPQVFLLHPDAPYVIQRGSKHLRRQQGGWFVGRREGEAGEEEGSQGESVLGGSETTGSTKGNPIKGARGVPAHLTPAT